MTGTGAGNLAIDNNRRLSQSFTSSRIDVFEATMPTGGANTFSTTPLGGGATTLSLQMNSGFQSWNPGPAATTSINYDTQLNVPLFVGSNTLTLSFSDASSLVGTIQSITFSPAPTSPAVPEPSTYALLGGLGALGFAFWRRRK